MTSIKATCCRAAWEGTYYTASRHIARSQYYSQQKKVTKQNASGAKSLVDGTPCVWKLFLGRFFSRLFKTGAHVLHKFDVFILALYLLSHGCALVKYTCKQTGDGTKTDKLSENFQGEGGCNFQSKKSYCKPLTLIRMFFSVGYFILGHPVCVNTKECEREKALDVFLFSIQS